MHPPNEQGGEFDLIARYFLGLDQGPGVTLGNGDDAALLSLRGDEELAVSSDMMVEGRHFPKDSPASEIAYRAVACAASDLAAMGARPLGFTLAISLPDSDSQWLAAFRCGLADVVSDLSLPLVGGDLTRGPLTISVQVMGAVPATQALTRSGANIGDSVWVSGYLGDAAAGLAILEERADAPEPVREYLLNRFWRPQPALGLGQLLREVATSAIDISDGLLADCAHIALASNAGIELDVEAIPLSQNMLEVCSGDQALQWALSGGDDYVLVFTAPDSRQVPDDCFCIGEVVAGSGVKCDAPRDQSGYRHF